MPTELKPGRITIRRPLGGWIPSISNLATSSPAGPLESVGKNAESQYTYSSAISLFLVERFGHIGPGNTFSVVTDSGTRINHLPINGSSASTSDSYIILKNGRIVRLNNTGSSTDANYDTAMTGTHGAHTIADSSNVDILTMKDLDTTPVEWVIWSWEDGTDADVGIIKLDLSTGADPDWFSATVSGSTGVLKKGYPHKITFGPDANLYVLDRDKVRQVTISGALTAATYGKTLSLGSSWVATGICNHKNYVMVVGHQEVTSASSLTRSLCRVWLWDGFSNGYNFSFDIPDNFAHGIASDGQQVSVITRGRNNTTKVWEFNGSDFSPKFESAAINIEATTPLQGGMDIFQNSLLFGDNTKRIYRWFNGGLHHDYIATDGTNEATTMGMVKNFYQGQIFVGVNYSSTYKVFSLNTSGYYTPSDFRTQLYDIGFKSSITRIRVYFSQFGTGASVLFSLIKNYGAVGIGSGNDVLNKTVDFATYGAITEIDLMDINMPSIIDVSSFYINLRFNHASITNTAAIVRKIEIDYTTSTT